MSNFPHLRRISQAKWIVVREFILLWTLKGVSVSDIQRLPAGDTITLPSQSIEATLI
jgi:hypothetical protein